MAVVTLCHDAHINQCDLLSSDIHKTREHECTPTYLMMRLFLHVNAIHCNHTVPGAQTRFFCGGAGLHFADELSALPFLAMQVKSIPVLPFCHETKPWFPLAAHFLLSVEPLQCLVPVFYN